MGAVQRYSFARPVQTNTYLVAVPKVVSAFYLLRSCVIVAQCNPVMPCRKDRDPKRADNRFLNWQLNGLTSLINAQGKA